MTLTRQRKASLGLLVLALGALAADRVFLGTGGPARAAAAQVPANATDAAPAAHARPAARGPSLAALLESIASEEGLDPVGVENLFASEKKPVEFVLTTMMGAGPDATVVVNKQQLRVGDHLAEGPQLVRVSREGAFFLTEGGEVFVPLSRPPADHAPTIKQSE